MKKYILTAGMICLPVAVLALQSSMEAVGITPAGLQSQAERALRQYGDMEVLPNFGSKAVAAAKALDEAGRAALLKEIAAQLKPMVMSAEFQAAHTAYIKQQHKAADHGIKVKSMDDAVKATTTSAGAKEFELKMKREMAKAYVQMAMETRMDSLKEMFDYDLKEWTKEAGKPNGSDRAKYQKMVKQAQAIQGLTESNPDKFRRGYAVLKSTEADGLDTEEALFGAQAGAQQEAEQLAWDKYNLKSVLKRKLTQVVTEAPTVDFAAQTVQRGSTKYFANQAYERKSPTWKAMYRAGKAPTMAALEIARAWLKEL
jgi:hypothetical protein